MAETETKERRRPSPYQEMLWKAVVTRCGPWRVGDNPDAMAALIAMFDLMAPRRGRSTRESVSMESAADELGLVTIGAASSAHAKVALQCRSLMQMELIEQDKVGEAAQGIGGIRYRITPFAEMAYLEARAVEAEQRGDRLRAELGLETKLRFAAEVRADEIESAAETTRRELLRLLKDERYAGVKGILRRRRDERAGVDVVLPLGGTELTAVEPEDVYDDIDI
jgi:hypothetical protein